LFTGIGTRILVPVTSRDGPAAMLNLKFRLARHGLGNTTSVGVGE
jgi:hypothetical protein